MDPSETVNAAARLIKSLLAIGTAAMFSAVGQSPADLVGWQGLLWGTSKETALKTLQQFHVHECAATSKACAPDELIMDAYTLNGVVYEVEVFFAPKYGLSRVTMSADDDHFRDSLAELTRRFGKPGLESEYDAAHETTSTQWIWVTPHGKLTLDSNGADGTVRITCQARLVGK